MGISKGFSLSCVKLISVKLEAQTVSSLLELSSSWKAPLFAFGDFISVLLYGMIFCRRGGFGSKPRRSGKCWTTLNVLAH